MNWTITDSNGTAHNLECKSKAFSGSQITVDTNTYKVKSSNWFVNLIDYTVDFPGVSCHIVMIGNKARLVVNGKYSDDGMAYEPITGIPAWTWALVAFSVLGGWFFGGILCCAVGVVFSAIYVSGALEKKTRAVALAFVGFIVIVLIFLALNLTVLDLSLAEPIKYKFILRNKV